jgi:hypothetical protein
MEAALIQVVENWAWLECRVISSKAKDGFIEVEVELEKSVPHESYPNLIQKTKDLGPTVIRIKRPSSASDLPARFRIKARRAGQNIIWGDAESLVEIK